ncbi:hypothetical protein BJV77DRAFT_961322 [Russula vinacea]|nr:hypothetical protein BJV77DRAFT_961322 [Russula vinacea]
MQTYQAFTGTVSPRMYTRSQTQGCRLRGIDAFPNEVKQTQWAKALWQATCEEVGEHFECSTCMVRLLGAWLLKDAACNNFKVFKFKEGSSEEIRRYNQELRHTLLRDDAFHHKNQEDVTGFGEHRIIVTILQDALFEDNKSYGVKYKQYFNPISINLLALVFTMIRKKAGASDQVGGGSGSGAMGMTESMKERAKEALAGRTGETDDDDD